MNKFLAILLLVLTVNVFCDATQETNDCADVKGSTETPLKDTLCHAVTATFADQKGYKCCFIDVTEKNVKKECIRLENTADAIGKYKSDNEKDGAKVDIQCSSSYLAVFGLFVFAFLF